MSLLAYWPAAEEVNHCIKPEAEGVHDAVLLAVHQPAPLTYRLTTGDGTSQPTTEEELFEYFVSEDVPTGAHVVPITGASGIGKSHLIRMLAARLKASSLADKYVVIRIPKSASLRKVVELILEKLPSEKYADVKSAFSRALAEVDLESATIRFQAALDISLRDLAKDLREQLKQDRTRQLLRERLDHAQRLPLLLSDAVTVDHFRTKVLPRVVRRAVAGRDVEVDEELDQFTAQDFDLDGIDLGQASGPVALYYRTALEAREGKGKKVAADVLNEVMDPATRQLFQLQEALGGMSLQDVILEIRSLLLKEGRELVMLVEDFKALTGIQETLLNVLIQEGVRDGERQYATMRSAIAVTDGYLTARDTIATRAVREWVIESRLQTEEEVLSRTKQLVAAYLNAARWGHVALIREHHRRAEHRLPVESQTAIFSSDNEDRVVRDLEPFGTVDGISLFPFTNEAIEYFARTSLTQGDSLLFRPRAIINGVLRDVLLNGREAFLSRTFPPASFRTRAPTTDIAQWLASLTLSEEVRLRYERFIVIYANNPQTVAEIGTIHSQLYAAFALPPPPTIKADTLRVAPRTRSPSPVPSSPPAEDNAATRQFAAFKAALEAWVQEGSLLDQGAASRIRTDLAEALTQRIDWNAERRLPLAIQPNQISIPNARGEGSIASAAIHIAPDNQDPDGHLRSALLALYRLHHINKQRLNYDEADEDVARVGNFVDRLLPAAIQIVRTESANRTRVFASLLSANSRLLGISERGRNAGATRSFLFGDPPSIETLGDGCPAAFLDWRVLQRDALTVRPQLVQMLLESAGCFQGKGDKANGVDISRITDALAATEPLDSSVLSSVSSELRQTLTTMSDQRVQVRAKRVATEAKKLHDEIGAKFGTEIDKNGVADVMKELAEELRLHGSWEAAEIGLTHGEFRELCEAFRSTSLKEALAQAERIGETAQPTDSLSVAAVAQLSLMPLLTAQRFAVVANRVVQSANRIAATLESQFHDVNPDTLSQELLNSLERVVSDLADSAEAQEA